jgi:hypothetical protein
VAVYDIMSISCAQTIGPIVGGRVDKGAKEILWVRSESGLGHQCFHWVTFRHITLHDGHHFLYVNFWIGGGGQDSMCYTELTYHLKRGARSLFYEMIGYLVFTYLA